MDTPRRTRLLLLADSLHVGGNERQIVELVKGLRRNGRVTTLLGVLDRGGALVASAAAEVSAVLPIRRRARYDVSPVVALWRAIHRQDVDLIHAIGWMSGWAGLAAARGRGIPLVYSGIVDAPAVLKWRARMSRACALRSDAAVANGNAALAAYRLRGQPHVVVISNGIDLDRFTGVTAPAERPTICMVANFSDRKDHLTVVRALPVVRRHIGDAELLLVGHDAGTLPSVHGLVRDLGIGGAVRFVTTSTAPEPLIASAHVGVLSSPSEGVSNALLEYMAAARPVVATDSIGNAAVVVEGETGFLVPFGSPDRLADRLVELLGNPVRARAMGTAGRRRVEQQFSLARMVTSYEDLYTRLLRRPQPSTSDVTGA